MTERLMAEATDAISPARISTPDRLVTPLARQRLSPLAWKRFVPNEAQVAPQTTLSEPEVQNKCFAVLGYLEEYYYPSSSSIAEVQNVDLNAVGIPGNGERPRRKSGLEQLEEQADEILKNRPNVDDGQPQPEQRHQQLEHRLSDLLAIPEVKDRFEKEFDEELPRYQAASRPMRQVRDIDRVTRKLRRAIYKRYLDDKKEHGKLAQSSVDQIYYFQSKLDELEQQKEGIEKVASPTTLGYLETQKILDYKKQLQEQGFVMTPSREQLIDRITREALAGKKIFLVGSTGTGKTQLAFYALNNLTGGYELINWHEGTTPRDIFGYRELWTDEAGGVESGMKPGPVPKALEKGVGVIHEEYTGGSTRTQLAAKFMMGARAGDRIQIPGFNGKVFDVTNNFIEIFTGNPKDEKTKQREDMDPAILRELTGIEVNYMTAPEMGDIIRARLITESGVLKLSQSENEYIDRLTKAAEMMQRMHNRNFEGFSTEMRSLLGIDAQGNTDTTLNTNFLDPGTLFKFFDGQDLASARATKGQTFASYISERIAEFITDPKSLSTPEERKALQKILHAFGLITNASGDVQVSIPHQNKGYILSSEMAGEIALSTENPMGSTNTTERRQGLRNDQEEAKRLLGNDFLGPEAIEKALDVKLTPELVPDIPFTQQELERAKELGQFLILRIDKMPDGTPITMQDLNAFMAIKKGQQMLLDTDWYKNEVFFTTETPKARWALVSKDIIPSSTSKNYLQQTEQLASYLQSQVFRGFGLPSQFKDAIDEYAMEKGAISSLMRSDWQEASRRLAALKLNQLTRQTQIEALYDMAVYSQNNGERLLEDKYTWSSTRSSDDALVLIGSFRSSGAYAWVGFRPAYSDPLIGVSFSRVV